MPTTYTTKEREEKTALVRHRERGVLSPFTVQTLSEDQCHIEYTLSPAVIPVAPRDSKQRLVTPLISHWQGGNRPFEVLVRKLPIA